MKLFLRFVAALALLVAVLLITALLIDTTERPSPAELPGYATMELSVAHRDVPLTLHVWYPAQQEGAPELIGQNGLFYGHHVLRQAPGLPGLHPVVVMSHGSGGNAPQLGWLASDLARSGMIVVATNHPGTTSRDSDPHRTPHIWERSQDMARVLDAILAAPPAGLQADAGRVASLGFSLGGFTALSVAGAQVSKQKFIDYCEAHAGKVDCGWMQDAGVDFTAIDATKYEASYRDPRITAALAFDPALPQAMTEDSLAAMDLPVAIVNLGEVETVPAAMRADSVAARIPGAKFKAVPRAHHFSFLQECSGLGVIVIGLAGDDNICSDRGFRDRGELHDDLSVIARGFLRGHFGLE